MKKSFLVLIAILVFSTITQAQPGNPRLKKRNQPTAGTTEAGTSVKLDDLKNPFDTTKKVRRANPQETEGNTQTGRRKRGNAAGNGVETTNAGMNEAVPQRDMGLSSGQMKKDSVRMRQDLKVIRKDYKSKNGKVELVFEKTSTQARDGIRTNSDNSTKAMCLTKEEVRGKKIETLINIADGSTATDLLPGGVIDATVLLNTGEFTFINMTKRKPITLTLSTDQGKRVVATASTRPNANMTGELRAAVHRLKKPSNIDGMPNMSSNSEAMISTLNETISLHMGGSAFYSGIKAHNKFEFSAEKYRYMYMYTFEQVCFGIDANEVTSPNDVFTEQAGLDNNWLYVQRVNYGRRLYVLMESEYDLQTFSAQLRGKLNWGAVSGKFNNKAEGSRLAKDVNIRVYTQGGMPLAITDETKIQEKLDEYFAASFQEFDIVPLSYKLTHLDGTGASLVSSAFLDGEHCLEARKVRIWIKSIDCVAIGNNKTSEEVYGNANFKMYSKQGQLLLANGTPAPVTMPTGAITYGEKNAPYNITLKNSKNFQITDYGRYADMVISDLDLQFQIIPTLHEKDNGLNSDDNYITDTEMPRTSLRRLLTEGTTSQSFEFRRRGSVIVVNFEITPM